MPLPSKRDPEQLRAALEQWFCGVLGHPATVGPVSIPEGTGMSSETLLFDLTHEGRVEEMVARVQPDMNDWPVFEFYDLAKQAAAMRLVASQSDVPVPEVPWVETDERHLGAPFIVMRRVHGRALPDMPPYVFGGSFLDAMTAAEQRELQRQSASVLARLHAIDAGTADLSPFGPVGETGDESLSRQLDEIEHYYRWTRLDWAYGDTTVPLIDAAIQWLHDHRPSEVGPTVLNWGDARPGNILFDGTRPAAALDWEMVNLGPAAIDVGWMILLHEFFQSLSVVFEVPGFPEFCKPDDVHADYVEAGGRPITDLDWYITYAATRFAVVSVRTSSREVAYGNREAPVDPADLIMHRDLLAAKIGFTFTTSGPQ
jgi:aminoglycoside phosphotransferase (APT) family kinase protein